jgi:hypothetical protein
MLKDDKMYHEGKVNGINAALGLKVNPKLIAQRDMIRM